MTTQFQTRSEQTPSLWIDRTATPPARPEYDPQYDQQYEIRRERPEGRLNGMMDLGVRMHRATALDRHPFRFQFSTPGARGRRRAAEQLA